jgi:hypothetical protein
MKTLMRASTAAIIGAMAREFPDTAIAIEFQEPEPLPSFDMYEPNPYPSGGKWRRGGKRKWKGRDKVKAARKQRRSQ